MSFDFYFFDTAGYSGPRCLACAEGWGKSSRFTCTECPTTTVLVLKFTFLVIAASCAVMALAFLLDQATTDRLHVVYLKVF